MKSDGESEKNRRVEDNPWLNLTEPGLDRIHSSMTKTTAETLSRQLPDTAMITRQTEHTDRT